MALNKFDTRYRLRFATIHTLASPRTFGRSFERIEPPPSGGRYKVRGGSLAWWPDYQVGELPRKKVYEPKSG